MIALGSVLGTVKDAVDELRDAGLRAGVLGITTYRPFPAAAVRDALDGCRRVVVLERALSPGAGGIVTADVQLALSHGPVLHTVIAGLGGRAITVASLRAMLTGAAAGSLGPLTFLDLDAGLVGVELDRIRAARRSGPSAENMLRDLGTPASPIG